MTKEQREAYVRQVCKDKGYDDTKTAKVIAAAHKQAEEDDDGLFDALIELPIKSSADYNKKVDELKAKATGLDTWHKQAQGVLAAEAKKREEAEARIRKFETKYGEIEEDDEGTLPPPKRGKQPSVSEIEQLKADMAARDGHYLNLIADGGDIVARHARMFKGEIISTRDLLKAVGEAAADPTNPRNITMEDAYLALHGERVKEAEQLAVKSREDALRNEGREEIRKQFAKSGGRSGAAISEDNIVFNALDSEGKTDDPNRKLTEQDRLNLLAQDLRVEMDKRAQAEA